MANYDMFSLKNMANRPQVRPITPAPDYIPPKSTVLPQANGVALSAADRLRQRGFPADTTDWGAMTTPVQQPSTQANGTKAIPTEQNAQSFLPGTSAPVMNPAMKPGLPPSKAEMDYLGGLNIEDRATAEAMRPSPEEVDAYLQGEDAKKRDAYNNLVSNDPRYRAMESQGLIDKPVEPVDPRNIAAPIVNGRPAPLPMFPMSETTPKQLDMERKIADANEITGAQFDQLSPSYKDSLARAIGAGAERQQSFEDEKYARMLAERGNETPEQRFQRQLATEQAQKDREAQKRESSDRAYGQFKVNTGQMRPEMLANRNANKYETPYQTELNNIAGPEYQKQRDFEQRKEMLGLLPDVERYPFVAPEMTQNGLPDNYPQTPEGIVRNNQAVEATLLGSGTNLETLRKPLALLSSDWLWNGVSEDTYSGVKSTLNTIKTIIANNPQIGNKLKDAIKGSSEYTSLLAAMENWKRPEQSSAGFKRFNQPMWDTATELINLVGK